MELLFRIERKLDLLLNLLQSQQESPSKAMMDSVEACKYLGISKSTLYKHTSAGKLPLYKPNGKLIMFKKEDLDKWLSSSKVPSNEELLNL